MNRNSSKDYFRSLNIPPNYTWHILNIIARAFSKFSKRLRHFSYNFSDKKGKNGQNCRDVRTLKLRYSPTMFTLLDIRPGIEMSR